MSEKNVKEQGKKKGILLVAIICIVVIVAIIVLFVVVKPIGNKTEDKLTDIVTEYYETNIKGKVIGVNQQKVTLKALSDAGYDVSEFKEGTYSLVKIDNPHETDKDKITYTIENYIPEDGEIEK